MDQLRQYILRVVIAAVLCGICVSLLGEKGTVGAMGKLVTGLVLALVMAAPFTHLSGFHFFDYLEDLQYQANVHTGKGQAMAKTELNSVIKSRVEEYIRDEAENIGASVEVSAEISLEVSLQIRRITLRGAVSPLHRQKIQAMILSDLNVAKEQLKWEN